MEEGEAGVFQGIRFAVRKKKIFRDDDGSDRQCFNRRIPDKDILKLEITAWEGERNQKASSVNWRFTTTDSRIKLRRLYPSIQT